MRILRFLAKSAVTAYGSYTKGQIIEVNDDFALHLIQNGLAEEVNAAEQPARFNKAFTPTENPEKKEPKAGLLAPQAGFPDLLPTGESSLSGEEKPAASSRAGRALQSHTSTRFGDKK